MSDVLSTPSKLILLLTCTIHDQIPVCCENVSVTVCVTRVKASPYSSQGHDVEYCGKRVSEYFLDGAGQTYALPSFKAVGLNFCTLGWWWQAKMPHMVECSLSERARSAEMLVWWRCSSIQTSSRLRDVWDDRKDDGRRERGGLIYVQGRYQNIL